MNNDLPDIIYEDAQVVILSKPAGFATQSARIGQKDCVSFLKEHLAGKQKGSGKEPYVGVVHRLDQPVAGLLVFAKDRASAADLSRQVRDGLVNKHYTALAEGIIDAPEYAELTDLIGKDPRTKNAVIADGACDDPNMKEARLLYRTEKIITEKNATLLSIELITGRYHQIRAQLSHMGHPIAGDRRYGATSSYPKGIALAADRLEFMHPLTGQKVEKSVDFSFFL